MSVQPTLLMIADIAGYTKFMKFHYMSLVHAQETVAKLLEAIIDAVPKLRLAKLEGDAAFFYLQGDADGRFDPSLVAAQASAIYQAFHARAADLRTNTLCPCDGCLQAGDLKIKLVGHVGTVALQKVKKLTELAGVDVIVVHRMLKNDVPVAEYLLVTRPVYEMLDSPLRERLRRRVDYAGTAADGGSIGPAHQTDLPLRAVYRRAEEAVRRIQERSGRATSVTRPTIVRGRSRRQRDIGRPGPSSHRRIALARRAHSRFA